jgi:1-phosphofructokinase
MIYTLTLNPAIDYVVRLPALREGETNRALTAEIRFGGKGINVSHVLGELGMETTALGFTAGFTGDALTEYLTRRGISSAFIHLSCGQTRINVKLGTDSAETEINAPGPVIPPDALEALLDKLEGLTARDTLVLAGSIPPSLPRDLYGRIAARSAQRGIRVVVDAEGEALTAALPFRPFLIKPNRAELEGIAGRSLTTEDDIKAAAEALQTAGAHNVLVSPGSEGALLLDELGGFHRAPAAAVTAVNTVGAGDSMVAGFLAGIERGYDYALRLGIAAGGATAATDGIADGEAIRALMA